MRRSSYFVFGALCGALGVLLFERVRVEREPNSAEILSKRVTEYLGQLESRLDDVVREKGKKV
jgi:hypothetical protein